MLASVPYCSGGQDRRGARSREARAAPRWIALGPCYRRGVTATGLGWRTYLALDDAALLRQCDFDRFRASGPGGQKRNVTDSAVRLRHGATGLSGEANESRSQHENRRRALRRLRRALALGLREAVDLEGYAPPPELAAARTADGRLALGRRDARFLPAVAALFDLLEATGWRLGEAARRLRVSTAQIGRFLAQDVALWRAASERRRAHGLGALRAR